MLNTQYMFIISTAGYKLGANCDVFIYNYVYAHFRLGNDYFMY